MYLDKNLQGEWGKVFTTPHPLFLCLRRCWGIFGKATADGELNLAFAYRMGKVWGRNEDKKKKRKEKQEISWKKQEQEYEFGQEHHLCLVLWPFGQLQRPTNLSNRNRMAHTKTKKEKKNCTKFTGNEARNFHYSTWTNCQVASWQNKLKIENSKWSLHSGRVIKRIYDSFSMLANALHCLMGVNWTMEWMANKAIEWLWASLCFVPIVLAKWQR